MKRLLALVASTALSFASGWASAQSTPEQAARAFYQDGIRHFNLAEYDAAIDSFREAYRRVQDPELLFNIAQSYRRKGANGCRMALEFYRNYQGAITDSKRKAEVAPLIDEMERCDREASKAAPVATSPAPASTSAAPEAPTARPAAPPPPSDRAGPSRAFPIGLGIGGLAIGAVGGVLLASIGWDNGCAPRCSPDTVDGFRARYAAGWVVVGVGAAAVATGALVWALQSDPRARSAPTAWIAPRAGGVSAGGAF